MTNAPCEIWDMNNPVLLQPAYVLHRRPYRETSFILELFTKDHGRLSAIAKGVRKTKSSSQGLLQPFTPLLVSWTGRGELMTVTHLELRGDVRTFHGECLFAGFYLNELLIALLQKWDPHPGLFASYERALASFSSDQLDQAVLRVFEKSLMVELGYEILPSTTGSQQTIMSDCYYRFVPEQGFIPAEFDNGATIFSGKNLLAIARDEWQDSEVLSDAKRLTRLILGPLLGNRVIHSRKLFMS
jgi:DNA repair protein RecO (recombination protein O)